MPKRLGPVLIGDFGNGENGNACGLGAVEDTDVPVISDSDPKAGHFIMHRTTRTEDGIEKYLWQRAKILDVSNFTPANSTLKQTVLRLNPFSSKAYTMDAALGSENCGDGSDNGKIWFRVVNRAQAGAVRCAIFAREEKAMMENFFLTQQQVSGDGHCHRRALLTIFFGKGSDTPTRLRQIQELRVCC
jgi:hypothetical protein